MDEQPAQPADEAAGVDRTSRDDGPASGDVGGRSQVVVAERLLVAGALLDVVLDPEAGVQPALHRDLGDPGQVSQAHQVTDHGDLRVAGQRQVGLDLEAPGPVLLRSGPFRQLRGERGRGGAGGPQHGARVVAVGGAVRPLHLEAAGVDGGDDRAHVQLDPHPGQRLGRTGRELRTERRQRFLAAVEEMHRGLLRVELPVLVAQREGGDLVDLSRELDTGRPRADEREGQPAPPLRRVGRGGRHLERTEHPAPDGQRVCRGSSCRARSEAYSS